MKRLKLKQDLHMISGIKIFIFYTDHCMHKAREKYATWSDNILPMTSKLLYNTYKLQLERKKNLNTYYSSESK